MRTPQRTLTTLATLLAATLTLTACGNDSSDSNDDKIAGAEDKPDSTKKDESSPSPSSTGLPDFNLPDDIKVDISEDKTGNATKDKILQEHAESLLARQRIFIDLDPNSRYLTRYYTEDAQTYYVDEIKKAKKNGVTITGEYRYHTRKIESQTDDRAVITFCEDKSKAFAKDIKTDKIKNSKPGPLDHLFTTAVMRKTEHNTWIVTTFEGKTGVEKCQ